MRWPWLLMAATLGCAGGAKTDDTTTFGPSPNSGDGTTSVAEDETTLGDEEGTSSGALDEGTTGDEGGSTDEGDGSSSGGGGLNCTDSGTCNNATVLDSISGDQGSDSIDVQGDQPTWITFRVTEDDSDVFGSDLSFTVTLQSPAGTDFDLYVYRGNEGGSTGCGGTMRSSTNSAGLDEVSMSWGEGGGLANNNDDGAWVAVEIVAKNDMCAPPAEWTLLIEGNT